MRIDTEIVAEIRPGEGIGGVVANDNGRSSFTAVRGGSQDRLVTLDANLRSFPRGLRGRTAEEMRLVRHPPEFAVLQAVHVPDDGCFWHEVACFAGDFIVAKLDGPAGHFVAIDRDGVIHRLDDPEDGWLVGGPDDTWFAATSAGFRRYRLLAS